MLSTRNPHKEFEVMKHMWALLIVFLHVLSLGRAQQVPCYFIFGDSLVDNGNNNGLSSLARADYFPYGIDFPQGPTGRFTNGRTTVDVITELLGFEEYIPPYTAASGDQILQGINYASAAAGIREETGMQLGARTAFAGQVRNYLNTASQIAQILGSQEAANNHLSKCIYSIGLGSNDYLNNYFMPTYYDTAQRYTTEQWADILLQDYSQQLQILYANGARKFSLIGLGQIGCSPFQLAQNSPDGITCISKINVANQMFNVKLKNMVNNLNANTPGARFTFLNAYGIFQDMVQNAPAYGFTVTNAGCCGVGRNNGQLRCLPFQAPCINRNQYVFWDAFHPSDAANAVIGQRSYKAQKPTDAYPYDINQLAQL